MSKARELAELLDSSGNVDATTYTGDGSALTGITGGGGSSSTSVALTASTAVVSTDYSEGDIVFIGTDDKVKLQYQLPPAFSADSVFAENYLSHNGASDNNGASVALGVLSNGIGVAVAPTQPYLLFVNDPNSSSNAWYLPSRNWAGSGLYNGARGAVINDTVLLFGCDSSSLKINFQVIEVEFSGSVGIDTYSSLTELATNVKFLWACEMDSQNPNNGVLLYTDNTDTNKVYALPFEWDASTSSITTGTATEVMNSTYLGSTIGLESIVYYDGRCVFSFTSSFGFSYDSDGSRMSSFLIDTTDGITFDEVSTSNETSAGYSGYSCTSHFDVVGGEFLAVTIGYSNNRLRVLQFDTNGKPSFNSSRPDLAFAISASGVNYNSPYAVSGSGILRTDEQDVDAPFYVLAEISVSETVSGSTHSISKTTFVKVTFGTGGNYTTEPEYQTSVSRGANSWLYSSNSNYANAVSNNPISQFHSGMFYDFSGSSIRIFTALLSEYTERNHILFSDFDTFTTGGAVPLGFADTPVTGSSVDTIIAGEATVSGTTLVPAARYGFDNNVVTRDATPSIGIAKDTTTLILGA